MNEKDVHLGFEVMLIVLGCAGIVTGNITGWLSVNITGISLVVAGLVGAGYSKYTISKN